MVDDGMFFEGLWDSSILVAESEPAFRVYHDSTSVNGCLGQAARVCWQIEPVGRAEGRTGCGPPENV